MDKLEKQNISILKKIHNNLFKLSGDELNQVNKYIVSLWSLKDKNELVSNWVINDTVEKISVTIDLSKFYLPINEANNLMDKHSLWYWERAIAVYELHKAILNKFFDLNDMKNAELYVDQKIIPFFEVLLEDWILDSQSLESIHFHFKTKRFFLYSKCVWSDKPIWIYRHNQKFIIVDPENIDLLKYYETGIDDLIKWYINEWDWKPKSIWLKKNRK